MGIVVIDDMAMVKDSRAATKSPKPAKWAAITVPKNNTNGYIKNCKANPARAPGHIDCPRPHRANSHETKKACSRQTTGNRIEIVGKTLPILPTKARYDPIRTYSAVPMPSPTASANGTADIGTSFRRTAGASKTSQLNGCATGSSVRNPVKTIPFPAKSTEWVKWEKEYTTKKTIFFDDNKNANAIAKTKACIDRQNIKAINKKRSKIELSPERRT